MSIKRPSMHAENPTFDESKKQMLDKRHEDLMSLMDQISLKPRKYKETKLANGEIMKISDISLEEIESNLNKVSKHFDFKKFNIEENNQDKFISEISLSIFKSIQYVIEQYKQSPSGFNDEKIEEMREKIELIIKSNISFKCAKNDNFAEELSKEIKKSMSSYIQVEIKKTPEYEQFKEEKEKKDKKTYHETLASSEVIVKPEFEYNDYLESMSEWIVKETKMGGRFEYLVKGGMKEPFTEVIKFLQNGGIGKISPKAYETLILLSNETSQLQKKQKFIKRKIKKVHKEHNKFQNAKVKDSGKYKIIQQEIFLSEDLYQLGMQNLAKKALKMMEEKGGVKSYISSDDPQSIIDFYNNKKKDGYMVKNKHTDDAVSSLDSQLAGRVNLENGIMDQVIRSGAMFTVIANFLVYLNTGSKASIPYMIGGTALSYALAQGVVNDGINKIMYPDQMLNSILKESLNNEYYPNYFANPWEIALAKAINWPDESNKKTMKQDLKKLKKDKEKDILVTTYSNGRQKEEKLSFFNERKIKNKFEENVSTNDFMKGGKLEHYLPDKKILGPNGQMYEKDQFLRITKEHEQDTGMTGHMRYYMMNKIASRIGKKDSYLPYLNQLHQHYAQKEVTNKLQKLKG